MGRLNARIYFIFLIFAFAVPAYAAQDVIISDAWISSGSADPGTDFTITYTVKNQGSTAISSSFRNQMAVDASPVGIKCTRNSLAAGATSNCQGPTLNLAAGLHAISITADVDAQVSESNEGNNVYSYQLQVGSAANYDLIVTSITPLSTPVENQAFDLEFTVKNQGTSDVTSSYRTAVYIDGAAYGNAIPISGIVAGHTVTYTKYGVTLSAGSHTIRIVADSSSQVTETNENNNEMSKAISVGAADPCAGVTCPDTCSGTTRKYDGYCSGGTCQYSLETLSMACGYDPCAFMLCSDYCSGTTLFRGNGCSAGSCIYVQEQNSASCGYDACSGVSCPDKCTGTTWNYNGYCSGGACQYTLEPLSQECSYDPCAFMLCSDYCNGTTMFRGNGCSAGQCSYIQEQSSPSCISDPCQGVSCNDYCNGTTRYSSGSCSGGQCNYIQTPLSQSCGYVPPIQTGRIVVLDPGHTNATTEGILNRLISSALVTLLENEGFTVYETLQELDVNERADFADDLNADVLLSIHFNILGGTAEGSEAFYYDSDDQEFCENILPRVVNVLPSTDRGVKPDTASAPGSLGVLRSRNGTACLVEPEALDRARSVEFMGVNYSDFSSMLHSADYIDAASHALKDGILDYFANNTPFEPCAGVVCDDKCTGTTWNYNGHCSQGRCQYDIEPLSAQCSYDPCAFMLCSDYCNGTTRYSSASCSAGNCNYMIVQQNSAACGWVNTTNTTPSLADLKITGLSLSPSVLACNATRTVMINLEITNQNSVVANNVGVEYSAPGLSAGFSTLGFSIAGNSKRTERVPFALSPTATAGSYNINVSVIYGGTRLKSGSVLTIQPCGDYFIDNINAIPDIYQRNTSIGLPGGGWYQCGPSSVTNALVWLYLNGFTNLSSGTEAQALNSTVWTLSGPSYTNSNSGIGVDPVELTKNIRKYVNNSGYVLTNMKFQGWKAVDNLFATNVTVPNLDWIKAGIKSDSGVLLHQGWYTYNSNTGRYTRIGGHWVTAVGYGKDSAGNIDPNMLVIHDPVTGSLKNEYVNMTRMTSGNFSGHYLIEGKSAVGYHIMSGAYLLTISGVTPDYVILEGAIRFNVSRPAATVASSPPPAVQTVSGTGGSGGGGSGSSRTTAATTASYTTPAPAVPQVNPAMAFVRPAVPQARTSNLVQASTPAVKVASTATVVNMQAQAFAAAFTAEETISTGEVAAIANNIPLATVRTGCKSDKDCSTGESCMPGGSIQKLFTTPRCCPSGNKLVDGKCVPPKTAGWNEACSGSVSCRTSLTCISTASWWSIFNRDAGVCCLAGESQKDGKCLSKILRSQPVNR